eukprot:1160478-Pelagomonas_calceolata.AAC.9
MEARNGLLRLPALLPAWIHMDESQPWTFDVASTLRAWTEHRHARGHEEKKEYLRQAPASVNVRKEAAVSVRAVAASSPRG